MPLDLAQLTTCLQESDGRGVDTLDPRFQDIASLIEQADYPQAAAKCQETFSEGQADIRLIAWFFFGLFLQDGAAGLPSMFETATTLFRDRFAAVGPERKKEHHATAGMAWFLSKLADRVADDDPEKAAEAKRLRGHVTLEQVTAALAAVDQLAEAFSTAVPLNPQKVTDPIRRVREWLSLIENDLTVPPEPEPEPEPEPVAESTEDRAAAAPGAAPVGTSPASLPGTPMVEASFRMVELQARLAAFEKLIARGDLAKASLIAVDVMNVVENFDPRLYLPRLFASFFSTMAPRAIDLFGFQQKQDTPAWKVFDQLYRTDLDAFVACSEDDLQRMLAASGGDGGGHGGHEHDGNGNGNGSSSLPAAAASSSDSDW